MRRKIPDMRPGSDYFVGRVELCKNIIDATQRTNAVLLFGGRQAGKTTTLLHLRTMISSEHGDVRFLSALDIPVYIDLTSLPCDAEPRDFFQHLINKARDSCTSQIDGFISSLGATVRHEELLDTFIHELKQIRYDCGEVEPRFVFLLDESERILGERFPRGFQDNLFTLLFGENAGSEYDISMIFAGAQHLYAFMHDDTSPIGSRAIAHHIKNLSGEDVKDLTVKVFENESRETIDELAASIFQCTGGQVGLVVRMLRELLHFERIDDIEICVRDAEAIVMKNCGGLIENWTLSLTSEARLILHSLSKTSLMSESDIARILHEGGGNNFLTPRVCEEFQYMGIAHFENYSLTPLNPIFWDRVQKLLEVFTASDSVTDEVWRLVEKTELDLRELVKKKFNAEFSSESEFKMKSILGTQTWNDIQNKQQDSKSKYKYSPVEMRDVISCMYLGDYQKLMINRLSWHLFTHMFRDKRALEDMFGAITQVRNDRAHFSNVPSKELERCRIACDDLLVIIGREVNSGEQIIP